VKAETDMKFLGAKQGLQPLIISILSLLPCLLERLTYSDLKIRPVVSLDMPFKVSSNSPIQF
jgi:hypothetical protein